MRGVFSATVAMSALLCLASPISAKAPLAVYYSFDSPPPASVFHEMQLELGRILAPSGMSADWIPVDLARARGEDFASVVVVRLAGHCSFEGFEKGAADPSGQALAETDTVEGHVLPFSKVSCDRVGAFIAPALKSMPPDWKNEVLGRALARVSAHEIYHMLTGVAEHGERGIFQAGHSRRDLTAATFAFAAPENNWLRRWLQRQEPAEQVAQLRASDGAVLTETDSADFAGR